MKSWLESFAFVLPGRLQGMTGGTIGGIVVSDLILGETLACCLVGLLAACSATHWRIRSEDGQPRPVGSSRQVLFSHAKV
jgi:hypothetical protein